MTTTETYPPHEIPDHVDVRLKDGRVERCIVIGQATKWPRVVTPDGGYAEFARETLMRSARTGRPVTI